MGLSDAGGRWRTTGVRMSYGAFSVGANLFTGDPGLPDNRPHLNGIYVGDEAHDPNQFRLGAAYIGFGDSRIGWDSEMIRHILQNRFAHDIMTKGKSEWFKWMPSGYPGKPYGGTYILNKYSLWE